MKNWIFKGCRGLILKVYGFCSWARASIWSWEEKWEFSLILAANSVCGLREEQGPPVACGGCLLLWLLNSGENRQLWTQSLVMLQRKLRGQQGLDKVVWDQLRKCDTLGSSVFKNSSCLSVYCWGEGILYATSSRLVWDYCGRWVKWCLFLIDHFFRSSWWYITRLLWFWWIGFRTGALVTVRLQRARNYNVGSLVHLVGSQSRVLRIRGTLDILNFFCEDNGGRLC